MAAFLAFRNARKNRQHFANVTPLNDSEMRARYRFSNENVDRLCRLLEDKLSRPTNRSHALSVKQQVLISLRYLATGNFMQTIGDTFGIDKGTVSRVVSNFVDELCSLKDRFIKFPVDREHVSREQNAFYMQHGFPCVIGCIDCTHVRIISPGIPEERDYVNRKGFHSVNVQVTCDSQGRITSVNAAWPGAAHDSHILRSSNLAAYMQQHHRGLVDGVLLGDSGYPCRQFLLTPYSNPVTPAQIRYNESHSKTRCCVERLFGVWKRRFYILHSEIRLKPEKCSKVVIACAVLHNLAKIWGEPDDIPEQDDQDPVLVPYNGPQDGRAVRDHIANNYFN